MMDMRLEVEIEGKPGLSVRLWNKSHDRHPNPQAACREMWKGTRCAVCGIRQDCDHCQTFLSCADVFDYFSDVISYENARVELISHEKRFAFSGSAQCVAAFAIMSSIVCSGCCRLAKYGFLLRRFCEMQGFSDDIEGFDAIFRNVWVQSNAASPMPDRKEWHDLFGKLLKSKMGAVLAGYDEIGGNDTLRNACQILISVSSLALSK